VLVAVLPEIVCPAQSFVLQPVTPASPASTFEIENSLSEQLRETGHRGVEVVFNQFEPVLHLYRINSSRFRAVGSANSMSLMWQLSLITFNGTGRPAGTGTLEGPEDDRSRDAYVREGRQRDL
jgi:hypothetical protein